MESEGSIKSQKYLTLTLQSGAQRMFVTLPTFFLKRTMKYVAAHIIFIHGRINLTQNTTLSDGIQ